MAAQAVTYALDESHIIITKLQAYESDFEQAKQYQLSMKRQAPISLG